MAKERKLQKKTTTKKTKKSRPINLIPSGCELREARLRQFKHAVEGPVEESNSPTLLKQRIKRLEAELALLRKSLWAMKIES